MTGTETRTRARRSPTASELRTWRSFVETSEAVKNVVATEMQTGSGLSSADYSVLLALSEQPGRRMRSSLLAEHITWQRSRLSHHLGRMEGRGLICREATAEDSRGAEVVLTDLGASSFRSASAPHMHMIYDTFVSALTPEQLASVGAAMATLSAHLEAGAARPAGVAQ